MNKGKGQGAPGASAMHLLCILKLWCPGVSDFTVFVMF